MINEENNNKVINTADELSEEVINFLTKNKDEFTLEANNEGVLFIWKVFDEDGIIINVDMTFYETFQFVKELISSFNYGKKYDSIVEFAKEKLTNTCYVEFCHGEDNDYISLYHFLDVNEKGNKTIGLQHIITSNNGYTSDTYLELPISTLIKKDPSGQYFFSDSIERCKISNELFYELRDLYEISLKKIREKLIEYKLDAKPHLIIQ